MKQTGQKFALLAGLACSLVAQEQPPPTPPSPKPASAEARPAQQWVRRVIAVRHVNPENVRSLVNDFPGSIKADPALKLLVIAGSPEIVQQTEDLIRQIDVPQVNSADPDATASTPNVEITMHLVAMAGPEVGSAGKPPAALQPVFQKIESAFGSNGLYLLDTALMRGRAGSQNASGSKIFYEGSVKTTPTGTGSPTGVISQPTVYQVRLQIDRIHGAKGTRIVGLSEFSLSIRNPYSTNVGPMTQTQVSQGNLTITADLQENQPTVIGKGNLLGPNRPVFVILQARVL